MDRATAGRAGFALALLSAATFGTSGSFAASLIDAGWTPGSAVTARVLTAALLLTVPALVLTFDLSLDGRWGGVISGDKVSIDFSPCACGAKGPSIRDNVVRYADLEGDDKIGCAGTIDAYVRGLS